MTTAHAFQASLPKPLRLWPGVAIVSVQWLLRYGLPVVYPEGTAIAVLSGVLGGLLILIWWAFFSRAPRLERFGGIALIVASMFLTTQLVHESIAKGMMGLMFTIYAIPVVTLALVAWAVATRGLSQSLRRASFAAAIFLACGAFTLLRTYGITSDAVADFHWRWTQTPEERLLAQAPEVPAAVAPSAPAVEVPAKVSETAAPALPTTPTPVVETPTPPKPLANWPGFRGPRRDGIIPNIRIATDWTASPPVEIWRRPIGPGWSSFAVQGNLLYTQEQRGADEVVACYSATTGKPVWSHRDPARFWESNAGAGPRGTPTLANGRVYSFGATGILNALNASTGAVIWSRNAASDTQAKTPGWGFASSPVVVDNVVIVATSGRLAAYDAATGEPRWQGPEGGGGSYSSPHVVTIDGVVQVVLMSAANTISVAPADGTLLWEHKWPSGDRIVQPALAPGGILINASETAGLGLRRLAIARGGSGWTVEERWTSAGLKPYFNDYVVHKGHAFGFDGSILSCVDLNDGKRNWKGGRFGQGQLVLLPAQDLLLVLSEQGELALVSAMPGEFKELARFPAIEGKTWNHPVLVGDTLLVRNSQEMAAFHMTLARP